MGTSQLEEWVTCDGLALLIRPIEESDSGALRELLESLSMDYGCETVFAAVERLDRAQALLGVVRLLVDPEGKRAEMAIAVRSTEQGRGIGTLLMDKALRYARGRGIAELHGMLHASNTRMLSMARRYGVTLLSHPDGILQASFDVANVEIATPCLPY